MTQKTLTIMQSGFEAFCASCPSHEEVTNWLEQLGFKLVLTLDATNYPPRRSCYGIPSLPAQYHYRNNRHNTDVIYLAGTDTPEDEVKFPPHASRWWIYPSAYDHTYPQIKHALTVQWSLVWQAVAE